MNNKLLFGVGALTFAGCALFGLRTGRFKTMKFNAAPYIRRRDNPVAFWTYAALLICGAALLAYMSIFVA